MDAFHQLFDIATSTISVHFCLSWAISLAFSNIRFSSWSYFWTALSHVVFGLPLGLLTFRMPSARACFAGASSGTLKGGLSIAVCDSVFTVSLVDFLDFGNFLPIMVSPAFIHACLMLFHASCAVSFFFDSDVRPSSSSAATVSLYCCLQTGSCRRCMLRLWLSFLELLYLIFFHSIFKFAFTSLWSV